MPSVIKILFGQTLADLAISQYGSVEALFALANENSVSITDEAAVGSLISLPVYSVPTQVYQQTVASPVAIAPQYFVKTKANQTMVDIAMMDGSLEELFQLAALNDKGITDDLQVGNQIQTVNNIAAGNFKPASGIQVMIQGGIGYMQISTSFRVS